MGLILTVLGNNRATLLSKELSAIEIWRFQTEKPSQKRLSIHVCTSSCSVLQSSCSFSPRRWKSM